MDPLVTGPRGRARRGVAAPEVPVGRRVLIAEDHAVVREGFRLLLEREGFEVVAEAADGHEARRLARQHRPEIVVLDLGLPLLNGVEAVRGIHEDCPEVRAVALTVHAEEPYVLAALEAGFRGYVLKSQATADLVEAIRQTCAGDVYLSPALSRVVVDAYLGRRELPADPLTPREREVLQLVAEGKSTKEIARLLGISVKTAESHRDRIKAKLEIHDVAGLVRYAVRRGLVAP